MNKLYKRALIVLGFIVIHGFTGLPVALSAPQDSDLQKISLEIKSTQNRLQHNQHQHNQLLSSLEKSEIALGNIEIEKNALLKAVTSQQQELNNLHRQEKQLLEAKTVQEKNIAAQINAGYRIGHEKNVKVILNQQDSRSISRLLAYSDYITRARATSLKTFEATLQQLADNKLAVEKKTAELVSNQNILAEKSEIAKASYAERNQALQALQATIKTDESKITQLKDNQNRLQELLRRIRAQQIAADKAKEKARREQAQQEKMRNNSLAKDKPAQATITRTEKKVSVLDLPANHLPFAQAKGRLRWPVKGRMDNRFGQTRQPGNFHWDGISFIASTGAEVQAVHSGRIVFADWFRGKGLLIIIDHGNGYMTLYAHNQTLMKKTGELVNSGDTIATVGSSGGLSSPELYFELRHQGEPVNPANWLNKG